MSWTRVAVALWLGVASPVAATPWEPAAPSPVPRFEGATAVVGGRLYAFGGFGAGGNLPAQANVDAYDVAGDTWITRAPMPRVVTHVQAAVVGTRVFLGGGFEGPSGGPPIAVVQVYDSVTDTWSTTAVPDLPAPRASGGFVARGRFIHALGGLTPGRCIDTTDHWVLDTQNLAAGWVAAAALPESRNHFQAVVWNDRIYVTGGQRGHDCGSTLLRSAQVYDPSSDTWRDLPPLPFALSHHEPSVFVWNDQVVIGGGITDGAGAIASAIAFDLQRERWTRRPDLPAPRRSPLYQRIGDRLIYGTGGGGTGGIAADAQLFVNRVRADAPRVLFLRGADRSGGFLEAFDDAGRTAQLADVDDFTSGTLNRGWGELRTTLEAEGFVVEQVKETAETASGPAQGLPFPLAGTPLGGYAAIVFGSNNASYGTAAVDAVDAYIRAGGAALFVSDANFGGDWADAPDSDQAFLDRFGLRMNQDSGTYAITRGSGEFLVPTHPVFAGVDQFDGEGVSPAVLASPPSGVTHTLLARAEGSTRVNAPPFGAQNQGALRSVTPNDAALVVGTVGAGRFAVHFDRNTFFNAGGAGTDLTRFDNRRYAVNLFDWLTRVPAVPPLFADGFEPVMR
jgi:hypothetical protein